MLETKFTALDGAPRALVKDGRFTGYASLFERADAAGDRVARGAFARSLQERGPRRVGEPHGVKLLWQHQAGAPIGVWERIGEDDRGLRVSGRLLLELQAGREAAALLAAGALDGLSIGFQTRRAEALAGGRRLLDVDLWEVSLVTFPMLAGARAAAPRDEDPGAESALAAARAALR